jgi:hypothetical protein
VVADGTHYPFDVVHAIAPDMWPGLAVIRIGAGQRHGNRFMRAEPPYETVLLSDTDSNSIFR